jgi:lipopolysaccharide/colanic/teichoic acid biosynthesis glycosyltransferase
LATFLPYWARTYSETSVDLINLNYSLVGTIVAITAGYFGFRQTSAHPGVRAGYGVISSFVISYGLVLSLFFFARIDYSRLQFLASFLICIIWYLAIYFRLRRERLTLGVLPFGNYRQLFDVPGPNWVLIDPSIAAHGGFDGIVADLRADIPNEWERFLADRALAGMLVLHAKQVHESLTGRVEIEHLSENNFGSLIPGIIYEKVKRAGDLIIAAIMAAPLLLMLVPVALWIKLDSKGPILFRQQRVGFRGDVFTVYKLRTMHWEEGEGENGRAASITRAEDDRVTRAGRLLRQYRIDELPQIINILKGDMSWIGPRPEAVPLSTWYESELPFYRYRHIVRPGITGWAQVNQGHVADVADVLWKLHYDFYYIRNYSVWLDLIIVARTIRTIISGFGAK